MVFDIEANGLKPTKIHCLSSSGMTFYNYEDMKVWLKAQDVLIGHNIVRFDIPALERILGIKIKARLVDTLALSWYLFPSKNRHGLEHWGEHYGVEKPEIEDWEGLSQEEYGHRCEEDVKINALLWEDMWKMLLKLYGSEEEAWRLIDYLTFKMDCAREQEESGWKLDEGKARALLERLVEEANSKTEELKANMPKIPIVKTKRPPARGLYKRSGELSVHGSAWLSLLKEEGLPEDFWAPVEVVEGYDEPNPQSHVQMKAWLDSLGWVPETFEFKRDKTTGDVRRIPQISVKGGGVCKSVKKLYEKCPGLQVLDGLSILNHRIGIVRGFIENCEDGYVTAAIGGLTNTLRFKHRGIVNLPGVDKAFGKDIRGCLIAPEGYELCGSDMSSLEDRTKQHYMWPHDPDYVKEMLKPDFDPHLGLAVFSGEITKEEEEFYKWFQKKN